MIKLNLTPKEVDQLETVLHDAAIDLEDDGRRGNPDAKLLWKVINQLREQQPCSNSKT